FECTHQRDGVSSIVELPIAIENASLQSVTPHSREPANGFRSGEQLRFAEGEAAGQHLINFEADPVVRDRGIAVQRHHEIHFVDKVRSVSQHRAALTQGVHDERQVELFQITHAAMHQLCAAAGCALCEVCPLQEHRFEVSGSGLNGSAKARGSASDYDNIPYAIASERL